MRRFLIKDKHFSFAIIISLFFSAAYSILTVVRHRHFNSFGFDLGVSDQVIWKYSQFKEPITTIDHIPYISNLEVHLEFIFMLLAPFYWVWSDAITFLLLEVFVVCISGLAVFLLARHYKLHPWIQFALLISYLMFYGVQNALWFDAHSATFGAAFLAWYIYFLVKRNEKFAILFFLLAILSKENFAGITFLISLTYFIATRYKFALYMMIASAVYLIFVFGIYYPSLSDGYRFQSSGGLFSDLNPLYMIDTAEKRNVLLYSFMSYGFIPFLAPLYLIPPLGNLASYFILGREVTTAQGLFLQYRVELVPLLSWVTIVAISKFKILNKKYIAIYLLICILTVQYLLHLPLSYLSKNHFWTEPASKDSINLIIKEVPQDASIVVQNNIISHLSHRDEVFSLWPTTKRFEADTPCGLDSCNWFRWEGDPRYLVVDTSEDWDIRHLLANRGEFIKGIENMESMSLIEEYKREENAVIYKINKNPNRN